jgi:hypothetical protein
MEFVEGLITFAVYGVVIAAVAMMTPRIGSGVVALLGLMTGRPGRITPAE